MHFLESLYFRSNFTKFVPKDPIDHKSVLAKVMAWHHIGVKSLPEFIFLDSLF